VKNSAAKVGKINLCLGSSAVEQVTLNHLVVGSNPARGTSFISQVSSGLSCAGKKQDHKNVSYFSQQLA
jgi:hypothetical protein